MFKLIKKFFKKTPKKLQFHYIGGVAYLNKKEALQNGLDIFNKALNKKQS